MERNNGILIAAGIGLFLVVARKLWPRLQLWRSPDADLNPALDEQIRQKRMERFDFLSMACAIGFALVSSYDTDAPSIAKVMLLPSALLFGVGTYLKQTTTPPRNVLARRYFIGERLLLLSFAILSLTLVYLALEPYFGLMF